MTTQVLITTEQLKTIKAALRNWCALYPGMVDALDQRATDILDGLQAQQPHAVPGLGRITRHDETIVLQFKDEASADVFADGLEPTVEVDDMPPIQKSQAAGVPDGAQPVYQITDVFEGDPKHTWRDATAGVYWSHPVSKRRILYRHISPPEAVGVPDRPCHVYNVEKRGSMCEWSPTTMAFALPDGVHALYTLATPPHPIPRQHKESRHEP